MLIHLSRILKVLMLSWLAIPCASYKLGGGGNSTCGGPSRTQTGFYGNRSFCDSSTRPHEKFGVLRTHQSCNSAARYSRCDALSHFALIREIHGRQVLGTLVYECAQKERAMGLGLTKLTNFRPFGKRQLHQLPATEVLKVTAVGRR